MATLNCVVVILIVCAWWQTSVCEVAIDSDGGYTGVVVAFKWSIDENENFIPKIKALLTDASRILYTATRKKAFFKEITIAVPSLWASSTNYESVTDLFDKADIRIDYPSKSHGDEPFTLQAGQCGERGQYIQLSPNYILTSTYDSIRHEFEKPHIRLVHEWAHLRYGVFDEFGFVGNSLYPVFYYSEGNWKFTICTEKVRGSLFRESGVCPLDINENTIGEIADDCFFVPTDVGSDTTASIMLTANSDEIVDFCDDEDEKRRHNKDAPNKQNNLCEGRSTWNIVSQNIDFQGLATRSDVVDTTPTFKVVRTLFQQHGRYVMVLDISKSMEGKPMQILHETATRFIQDKIPPGNELGIVLFSSIGRIAAGMTKITDKTRKELIEKLPKMTQYYTAIGKGLQMAVEVLKEKEQKAENGILFLITDGEENVGPVIRDVIPELMAEKVRVNAIALGPKASKDLEVLVSNTKGKIIAINNVHDPGAVADLDFAFFDTVISHEQEDFQPVAIVQDMSEVLSVHEVKAFIDEELGKDVIFTVVTSDIDNIDVLLSNPQNQWINSSSDGVIFDRNKATNRVLAKISSADHGMWKVVIQSKMSKPVSVDVTAVSYPLDFKKQPIRIRSWFNNIELDYPQPLTIYTHVTKGSDAVTAAIVEAKIDRPDGSSVKILLRDDGAGSDTTKDDGIYSNYFTNYNQNGRYSVLVTAKSEVQTAKRNRTLRSTKYKEATFATRISKPGVFKLSNWTKGDVIPPSRITDLLVVTTEYDQGTSNVTLQWTSTGDDMTSGTAQSLDLRVANNFSLISLDFDNTEELNSSTWVIRGSLTPQEGGTTHIITVSVPQHFLEDKLIEGVVLYFAIRAKDSEGNVSPVSNVARIFIKTPLYEKTEWTFSNNSFPEWLIITFCAAGAVLLIIFAVLIIRRVVYSKKRPVYQGVLTDSEIPRFLTKNIGQNNP